MITVATFHDTTEAHMAKNMLEVEGVSAILVDENAASLNHAGLRPSACAKLQVGQKDQERALRLLRKAQTQPKQSDHGWPSSACRVFFYATAIIFSVLLLIAIVASRF